MRSAPGIAPVIVRRIIRFMDAPPSILRATWLPRNKSRATRVRRLSRRLALALGVLTATATAAPAPCEGPLPGPRLLLGAERGEAASLRRSGGAESRVTQSRIGWRGELVGLPVGFGHTYGIHDISLLAPRLPATAPREPSANGHLHVLYAEASLAPLLPEGWELRVQPALAVSSNFLKSPDEISREAFQLNAAVTRRMSDTWQLGLCADHRFGDWRVYPTLAWLWESGPWSLRLGWPDSHLERRFGEETTLALELAPAGNRWRILDERIGDSRFVHEAWRLRWRLDWRPLPRWSLGLHADVLFEREYDFLLEDAPRYRDEADSVLQLGLEVSWRYQD